MRIVLDLQSCQTPGSKNRGIGRYSWSLAEAMISIGRNHEFFVVLNEALGDAAQEVRERLEGLLPAENIRTFSVLTPNDELNDGNGWRRRASQAMREAFIADLNPDAVHVTSLFEGLEDSAITSLPAPQPGVVNAVTLYDLIPLINPDPYLANPVIRNWYLGKIASFHRADLLMSISASSREEAIAHAHIPPERVTNISCAISTDFQVLQISKERRAELKGKFGLNRNSFVMYTGGIDYRKNIEGLIEAYSKLSESLRRDRQLAIVCAAKEHDKEKLVNLAVSLGLKAEDIVLTGFVSEEDLVALYNICELFVFPSLHEGFGLPALEAMACGAPTIGSSNSSIPEVLGWSEAEFDATDATDTARKMTRALVEPEFADALRAHGAEQAKRFSWEESARRALNAIETAYWAKTRQGRSIPASQRTRRLALVTPLPPLRTGIADYVAELLPYLGRYYDIELISDQEEVEDHWINANCPVFSVSEFEHRASEGVYDRILYQVGNSEFHAHMIDLMKRWPGTVVLHDFFLSGMQYWRSQSGLPSAFIDNLIGTSGYPSAALIAEHGPFEAIMTYPANGEVVRAAQGIIVHSRYNVDMLNKVHGVSGDNAVAHIPHLRALKSADKKSARKRLKIKAKDFVVCCFGFVAFTKLNDVILDAFIASELSSNKNCQLIFVGAASGDYGKMIREKIANAKISASVTITGFAETELYRDYLASADCSIQLRRDSRGETSGTILDCFAYGVPLITNAHGTFAELEPGTTIMLPEEPQVSEVKESLENLWRSPALREELVARSAQLLIDKHGPSEAARLYHAAIERFEDHTLVHERAVIRNVAQDRANADASLDDVIQFSAKLASNRPHTRGPSLFVDVSGVIDADVDAPKRVAVTEALSQLLTAPPEGWTVEPVWVSQDGPGAAYRYARRFGIEAVRSSGDDATEDLVVAHGGDVFLGLASVAAAGRCGETFAGWRARGVGVRFLVPDDLIEELRMEEPVSDAVRRQNLAWLDAVASLGDTLVCETQGSIDSLMQLLPGADVERSRPIFVKTMEDEPSGPVSPLVQGSCVLIDGRGDSQSTVVAAFERLWADGETASLTIVTALDEDLHQSVRNHPEFNHRLHHTLSDDEDALVQVLLSSSSIIAIDEIVEQPLALLRAIDAGRPVLVRRADPYRLALNGRVEGVTYIGAGKAEMVRDQVVSWLAPSRPNPLITRDEWTQETKRLVAAAMSPGKENGWLPRKAFKFRTGDRSLGSNAGVRRGEFLRTDHREGFLVFGPYLGLSAGRYEIQLMGVIGKQGVGGAWVDLAVERGTLQKGRYSLADMGVVDNPGALTAPIILDLDKSCSDLEVRLWVDKQADLSFRRMDIRPL